MAQEQNEGIKCTTATRNNHLYLLLIDNLDNKENHADRIFMSYINQNKNNKKSKRSTFTLYKSSDTDTLWYKIHQNLIKINYKVFKYINSDTKCKFLDFYISPISYCDSKKFNLSLIVILIISIGILWNNKKDCFWSMLILLASILTVGAILTYTLKHCFKIPRPLTTLENVNVMFETSYTNSFPSGHTQLVFTICTFMFMSVKKYWYWYMFLSLGVAFERVYSGNHFPFDVLIGAMIGIFFTLIILSICLKNNIKFAFRK
ncbi:MAG: phosphatase PAP2 family protein [Endomicrobium sp.]|nr:phosphatase PAP2 family protein [Endomicrobium sp.]